MTHITARRWYIWHCEGALESPLDPLPSAWPAPVEPPRRDPAVGAFHVHHLRVGNRCCYYYYLMQQGARERYGGSTAIHAKQPQSGATKSRRTSTTLVLLRYCSAAIALRWCTLRKPIYRRVRESEAFAIRFSLRTSTRCCSRACETRLSLLIADSVGNENCN